jgi:hypothetical protein
LVSAAVHHRFVAELLPTSVFELDLSFSFD